MLCCPIYDHFERTGDPRGSRIHSFVLLKRSENVPSALAHSRNSVTTKTGRVEAVNRVLLLQAGRCTTEVGDLPTSTNLTVTWPLMFGDFCCDRHEIVRIGL